MISDDLDDLRLVVALAQMWDDLDPAPDDLAERVILSVAMDQIDFELLTLVEAESHVSGTRGLSLGYNDNPSLTFSNGRVSVMVALSARPGGRVRLDGWVDPAGGGQVRLRYPSNAVVKTEVNKSGRFSLDDLARGMVRLEYTDPAGHMVAAPTFEI
ncbi:MAG: hypothetical protein ACK5MT_14240 [Actinomycetales bacterium]